MQSLHFLILLVWRGGRSTLEYSPDSPCVIWVVSDGWVPLLYLSQLAAEQPLPGQPVRHAICNCHHSTNMTPPRLFSSSYAWQDADQGQFSRLWGPLWLTRRFPEVGEKLTHRPWTHLKNKRLLYPRRLQNRIFYLVVRLGIYYQSRSWHLALLRNEFHVIAFL